MADDVEVSPDAEYVVATDEDGDGAHHQLVKVEFGGDGTQTPVSDASPLPVVQTGTPELPTGAATAAAQASILAAVDGVEAALALLATAAQLTTLIAGVAAVDGHVDEVEGLLSTIDGHVDGLEGLLTTIDGHVDGLEGGVGASADAAATAGGAGSLSAKLRLATSQLDAIKTAVEASPGLPSGAATEAKQDTIIGHVDGIESALTTIQGYLDGVEGLLTAVGGYVDGVETLLTAVGTKLDTLHGDVDGVETLLAGGLPAALGAGGGLKIDGSGTAVPVTVSGVATEATLLAIDGHVDGLEALTGALTETAPGTDTASSGLNGRLQRIAQRLTSLIALLPSSIGQKDGSGSLSVVLASDQAALPVTDNAGSLTVDAPVGTPVFVRLSDGGSAIATLPVSLASLPALATGSNAIGKLAANSGVDIGDVDVTSLPRAATATLTNVNDTAASTTLLASNANRLGATIYNDSTATLYVKFGSSASATSFTVKMDPGGYYEVPGGYTGIITGIWSADASGAARMTELTA